MVQIRSLDNTGFDTLFVAFSEAFKDYERTWNRDEFSRLLVRRGYVPELSFGAFEDKRLVSFTLNGIGIFNGKKTAYDTGTGTIREFAGKGLATEIFRTALPFLRRAGVTQYLLEVIQTNTPAVSIYTKLGFEKVRELSYFIQEADKISLMDKPFPDEWSIREISLELRSEMTAMHAFHPPWQNSFEAIDRKPDDFRILGAFEGDLLIGYGIIEPASGDIPQLAVDRIHRRKGLGTAILKRLLEYNLHSGVKVINTDSADEGMTAFLGNNEIPLKGKQFEMIRELVNS